MKNKVGIIIICVLIIAVVIGLIVFVSSDEPKNNESINPNEDKQTETITGAPSKIEEDEKEVSKKKQQELFNFIPKVYIEGISPFDSTFMLDAVMNKIIDSNEDMDFGVSYVDNMVKKIFGEKASIDKNQVSEPNVEKSFFYYSKEADSYAVIPVGYEGRFEYQIFKNATETDDAYYVYTYTLIGGYSYDEDSITQDEFGDVDYDNAKVEVIVGDKDGKDIVHIFDNYTYMYEEDTWLQLYSDKMPVFRYTLKKSQDSYYLTEVEQLNY